MSAYRNAAAHMYDHKIQGIVSFSLLLRITLCNSLLVQRMKHACAGKLGNAGISGNRHQLIHNHRVYNVGRNADGIGNFPCKDAA